MALALLVLLSVVHLWHQVWYVASANDLVIFNTFSYVAKYVLFLAPHSFILNPEVARVVPVEAMPLLYPPGIYLLTKLVSFMGDTQLTMHIFIFVINLLNSVMVYSLLRKVANRFISFSAAFFLMVYTASIVVVVDSFIQPLLTLVLLCIVNAQGKRRQAMFLCAGLLNGLIWIFRQNTGLFLFATLAAWIFFLNLSVSGPPARVRRYAMWAIVCAYLLCGVAAARIMTYADDRVWYMLCYLLLWGAVAFYALRNKTISLAIDKFAKDAFSLALPVIALIAIWLWYFHGIMDIRRYLYIQYVLPFKFIDVFEYPVSFHLGLAFAALRQAVFKGGLPEFLHAGTSFMRWGFFFLLPLAANLFFVSKLISGVLSKNKIDMRESGIISLPVVGILMIYPVESFWILSSKAILFFFAAAYFLQDLHKKHKMYANAVCVFLLLFCIPRIGIFVYRCAAGQYQRRYDGYMPVSAKSDVKLPAENAGELIKSILLIRQEVKNERFYVVDSFSGMEMYYGLTGYRHPNFYIYLRKDCLNDEAIADLLAVLKTTPYLLINKRDYDGYLSDKAAYVSRKRSIHPLVMDEIISRYRPVTLYQKPQGLGDPWICDFYIARRNSA